MPTKTPARNRKGAAAISTNPIDATALVPLSIDFPSEGEEIMPGHYAVRVSAGPYSRVEINVGGKEWFPCRESLAYYWFDWNPDKPGRVKLTARYAGAPAKGPTAERTCIVVGGGQN
jgi:hypothetical protein